MEIALTPSVKEAQETYYGRHQKVEEGSSIDPLGPREQEFIQSRDSFYMATVNEDSWPYIQLRGGPVGFLKIVKPTQLTFADYKGNRQLVSTGNLSRNNRVSLFLIDYPSRTRLKVLGTAQVFNTKAAPIDMVKKVSSATLGRAERLFVIDVVSFDWNCPQYITPRYTRNEIGSIVEGLQARIQELERS